MTVVRKKELILIIKTTFLYTKTLIKKAHIIRPKCINFSQTLSINFPQKQKGILYFRVDKKRKITLVKCISAIECRGWPMHVLKLIHSTRGSLKEDLVEDELLYVENASMA